MRLQYFVGFTCSVIVGILAISGMRTLAASGGSYTAKSRAMLRKVKRKQAGPNSTIVSVLDAHTAVNTQVTVTGDNTGLVTVKNVQTNAVIATFQMDQGVPVRQVFLSTDGQAVGAAQKDHTIFWSLANGQQTGRVNEEAYAFTPDGSKLFTYNRNSLNVYSYPGLQPLWQFSTLKTVSNISNLGHTITYNQGGPETWTFSANSRYLAVTLDNTRPGPDANYPYGIIVDRGHLRTGVLYDLINGHTVPVEWLRLIDGTFTADSQFYMIMGTVCNSPNLPNNVDGNFQVELATGTYTQLP